MLVFYLSYSFLKSPSTERLIKNPIPATLPTIGRLYYPRQLLPEKEKSSKEQRSSYSNYKIQTREYRLDIRGEKPDETEFKVIKFLDDSYVSGQSRIEILHGKGTGALKKTVIAILKKHDKVKDYYFAPIEAGGEGITIVEIK